MFYSYFILAIHLPQISYTVFKEPLSMLHLAQLPNICLSVKRAALKPVKERKRNQKKKSLLASVPVCHQLRMPWDDLIAEAPLDLGFPVHEAELPCSLPRLKFNSPSVRQSREVTAFAFSGHLG